MLSAEVRDELAADLAQAERSRVPTTPLTDRYGDIDVVDAYEIQLINIRQRVAEGARVIGHQLELARAELAACDAMVKGVSDCRIPTLRAKYWCNPCPNS